MADRACEKLRSYGRESNKCADTRADNIKMTKFCSELKLAHASNNMLISNKMLNT